MRSARLAIVSVALCGILIGCIVVLVTCGKLLFSFLSTLLVYKDPPVIVRRLNGYKGVSWTRSITCGQFTCELQWGWNESTGADLIFFNERDISFYVIPPFKNGKTLTGFLSKEPQNHLYLSESEQWDNFFNYSVTYSRHSGDGEFVNFRRKLESVSPKQDVNFAMKYSKRQPRVLWFVSHCLHRWKAHSVLSARVEYVQELSKHISIDVFTRAVGCKEQLGNLIKNIDNQTEPEIGEYTFYLSFESTNCKDYISEKFWKVLQAKGQTIPVALGGLSIEEYERVAPPNSFIHVKNFTSPEALAQHLKFVADDDQAFNHYHNWRNKYVFPRRAKIKSIGNYNCYFCEKAHEKSTNVWKTFGKDFGGHNCLDVSTPDVYCPYYNISCDITRHTLATTWTSVQYSQKQGQTTTNSPR